MRKAWRAGHAGRESRRLLVFLLGSVVIGFGYLWHLSTTPTAASAGESASIKASSNWTGVWHNPLNVPYRLVQMALLKSHLSHLAAARLASVIFVVGFGLLLYFFIRRWFGRPAAFFGAVFFLTTPYAMILGRTATPQVLLFSLAALGMVLTWALHTERSLYVAWFSLCLSGALALYVPGLVWLLGTGLILGRSEIKKIIKALPQNIFYAGIAAGVTFLIPLGWALATGHSGIRAWLWLPSHWASPLKIIEYLAWGLGSIFIKTPYHTDYILGRSPMLTITEAVLLVFGIYGLSTRVKQGFYWLAALIGPPLILCAINQSFAPLYLCLPVLVVLVAVGMRFLFLEWRSIFPLNPIPRYLAFGLISAILVLQVSYSFRYVLVAWPNNPAIKSSYVLK